MNPAKSDILARIRRAAGEPAVAAVTDYHAIPRGYQRAGTLTRETLLDLFAERLDDYQAGVYRCRRGEIAATVRDAAESRGKKRLVAPPELPQEWLPETLECIRDTGLSHVELDNSDGAITGCTVAIAMTGSIFLCHSQAEGRRALTLIPDYHLCVIGADQVVETVAEGLARSGGSTGLITTISGPSATADIEMTRVKGVHGPRVLDVVLVVE